MWTVGWTESYVYVRNLPTVCFSTTMMAVLPGVSKWWNLSVSVSNEIS